MSLKREFISTISIQFRIVCFLITMAKPLGVLYVKFFKEIKQTVSTRLYLSSVINSHIHIAIYGSVTASIRVSKTSSFKYLLPSL